MQAGLVGEVSDKKAEPSDEKSECAGDMIFHAQGERVCAVNFINDVEGPGDC